METSRSTRTDHDKRATIPLSACTILASLLALAGPAHAAFPGANGKLAFASDPSGLDLEVYSMSADGSAQTDLSNNSASDASPTWSPDGQKIAFSTDRPKRRDLPDFGGRQ